MADEFPLPNSSYKELIKIIQGYGRIGTEASLADVARLTAMNETGISGNNKFLVAIGIVKGGKKKTITPIGAELATALEHDLTEEAAVKWRAVVEATDFLQNVIAAVRIRKTMDESSLESHVAYSAGLLKEEGGTLIAVAPEPRPIAETVEQSLSLSDSKPSDNVIFERGVARASTRLGGVQLNIDVTVQCTPADLEDLGRKLRKVLKDFNEPEAKAEAPPQSTPAPPAPVALVNEVAEE